MALRSYGEACGIAHGFDLVGERWAGLVLRELLLGPKRFTDLAADLPGASASVLSDRLRELEERGVVVRRRADPPGRAWVYQLTPWGRQLGPILTALGTWALASPAFDPSRPVSDDSAALTLATYYVNRDPGWNAIFELRIGNGVFEARIADGDLTVDRGAARSADAVLSIDARPFTRMLGPEPEETPTADQVTGNAAALARLLRSVEI
jgi:DNA-binding HxlR family transcriptional regulator